MYQEKKIKVICFSYVRPDNVKAGREMLAEINRRILNELYGKYLVAFYALSGGAKSNWVKICGFFGLLDGLNRNLIDQVLTEVDEAHECLVFVEGSNYGWLVRAIKRKHPSCKIVVFFHNVETKFFWDALCVSPSMKAVGVLIGNIVSERLSVKYSDRIICLNERDSRQMSRIYGRGATDILPICVDRKPESIEKDKRHFATKNSKFGIFVGGAFYANIAGIRWYARNVAAEAPCCIYVIGRGFEDYAEELEAYGNIKVIGSVDSVTDWYKNALFVIAPIFDGSGMKTKVAESLMYGKPVIGTTEAFMGYEDISFKVGFVCDTKSSFLDALGRVVLEGEGARYDARSLRDIYEKNYSIDAARKNLGKVISDIF